MAERSNKENIGYRKEETNLFQFSLVISHSHSIWVVFIK